MLSESHAVVEESSEEKDEEGNDPELCYLQATLLSLRAQSHQLDTSCSSLQSHNTALDREIEELTQELVVAEKEAEEIERVRTVALHPLAALSQEVHCQKRELQELQRRGETLKRNIDRLNANNVEAEHRIYDLDDLVWKKSREISELQARLADSVPLARLQKTLCKPCIDLLTESAAHSTSESAPVARRQASHGTLLANTNAFSLYSLLHQLVVVNKEPRKQPLRMLE